MSKQTAIIVFQAVSVQVFDNWKITYLKKVRLEERHEETRLGIAKKLRAESAEQNRGMREFLSNKRK